jgi:DNA polymerase-3 subunit delta'
MPLIPLYGHSALRNRLAQVIARGTLPASILLHGPRGIGKQRLALWIAQLLICERGGAEPCGECKNCHYAQSLAHPDLRWFFPRPRLKSADAGLHEVMADFADATAERLEAGGLYTRPSGSEGIYVSSVRTIVQSASMTPSIADRKVFIIGDADRMVPQESSPEAANAFLKLLEEPPADTTLILTSSEPGALLPTIKSRVIAIRARPLTEDEMRSFAADPLASKALGKVGAAAERLRAAQGSPGALLALEGAADAAAAARDLFKAASGGRAEWSRAALAGGATGARGFYTDVLDALTLLLGQEMETAARQGNERRALALCRAIDAAESAKRRAAGNVNPQLLSAALAPALAAAS